MRVSLAGMLFGITGVIFLVVAGAGVILRGAVEASSIAAAAAGLVMLVVAAVVDASIKRRR